MTPKDLPPSRAPACAVLSLTSKPTNLKTLAVLRQEGDPDLETLTDFFVKASRTYAVEFQRRREARIAMLWGAIQLAVGLGAGLVYIGRRFDDTVPSPVQIGVEGTLAGLILGGFILLAWGGLFFGLSCYRS